MHRVICFLLTGFALSLVSLTGCMISHTGCESARGPIIFGAPCESCSDCGEVSLDSQINLGSTVNSSCDGCEGTLSAPCDNCNPVRNSLKRLVGYPRKMKCNQAGVPVEVTCGLGHVSRVRGSVEKLRTGHVCGIEEINCGITEANLGRTLSYQKVARRSANLPKIRSPMMQHAPSSNRSAMSSQKYPMDTPRIFTSRPVSNP